MSDSQEPGDQVQQFLPRFGLGFLEDHARRIMSDPKIALIELVANSWDAGADAVKITWPDPAPNPLAVEDNGAGMTYDEFTTRWVELNYNRRSVQGDMVRFPHGNLSSQRKVFGTNGKGRHSMFCFCNEYVVDTWRDGICNSFLVRRSSAVSTTPFTIEHRSSTKGAGHGTRISGELGRNHLPVLAIPDLIGSTFVADPTFRIWVNGEQVHLTDLEHLQDVEELHLPGLGDILVRCVDSKKTGRTSRQHGVAWWVNRRLVGQPSWSGFEEGPYLDARTVGAKRFTFVVEADLLEEDVEADWSGFQDTPRFRAVSKSVRDLILQKLNHLMRDVRHPRKLAALEAIKPALRELPPASRLTVGRFLDELQTRVPTLGQRELTAAVEIMSSLEKSKSGFALLEQLALLQPDELDKLSQILETWSIQEVAIVLSELEWRLNLIGKMEKLLEDPTTDELHDIQPLFERGLWIFGPEYDSIAFMSNRTLSSVIRDLFQDKAAPKLASPLKRPDLVALPDSSIGVYSRDQFGEDSEVSGIAKVLVVELKRGGFQVTRKEKQQALDYASELRKSGKVQRDTGITGYVLGTTVEDAALEPSTEGPTTVLARTYSTVLRQAHARTFNLLNRIRDARAEIPCDPDVEQVLAAPEQPELI